MDVDRIQGRAAGAIGIGVALAIIGGLLLRAGLDSFDGGAQLVAGWITVSLGWMFVQAGIVAGVIAPPRDD